MKREAIGHTKMKRLCRRLDIPLWQGVGLLESIWHVTGRECPRGDLGKLSNEDIALAIDYRGDENRMIEALLAAGWLDADPVERLIVHDWPEHADDAVNMRLARSKQHFVRGIVPKLTRLTGSERFAAHEYYKSCAQNDTLCAPPVPEPEPLPEPNQKPETRRAHADGLNGNAEDLFEQLWLAYPEKARTKKPLSMQYYIEEVRSEETHRAVLAAVNGKWTASQKWQKGYVLALPEWIHNRCWEESPAPADPPPEPVEYYDMRKAHELEAERRRKIEEQGYIPLRPTTGA